jgi:hypothetical protein
MKSLTQILEEVGMSAAELGSGTDGVLGPDDSRIPKKIGKIQKRKALEEEKADERIKEYKKINDEKVLFVLSNKDRVVYNHKKLIWWVNDKQTNYAAIPEWLRDIAKEMFHDKKNGVDFSDPSMAYDHFSKRYPNAWRNTRI